MVQISLCAEFCLGWLKFPLSSTVYLVRPMWRHTCSFVGQLCSATLSCNRVAVCNCACCTLQLCCINENWPISVQRENCTEYSTALFGKRLLQSCWKREKMNLVWRRRAGRRTCNDAADFNSAESDFVFSTTLGVASATKRPQITDETSLTTVVTDASALTKSRPGPALLAVRQTRTKKYNRSECCPAQGALTSAR